MNENLEKIKAILTKMGKMQVNLQSKSAIDTYAEKIYNAINKNKK